MGDGNEGQLHGIMLVPTCQLILNYPALTRMNASSLEWDLSYLFLLFFFSFSSNALCITGKATQSEYQAFWVFSGGKPPNLPETS